VVFVEGSMATENRVGMICPRYTSRNLSPEYRTGTASAYVGVQAFLKGSSKGNSTN